jgi:two-component system sensor histidine kinase PilS (NtrC family)
MDGLYARYAPPLAAQAENRRQNRQIFTIYNLYRLMLGIILLISYFYYRTPTSPLGSVDRELFLQLSFFYTGFNVLSLLLPLFKLSLKAEVVQFVSVIILDILILVLLSYTCGGVSSGMAHLLIVPTATGSILFGMRMSTFYAAVGSIAAIYSEIYLYLSTSSLENYYVQAGLLGLTLFATSLSLQYLGWRIRQKEVINRMQAISIQSLQEMNQRIIQRMQTGIVVVDKEAKVLNCNDSARRLLQSESGITAEGETLVLPPVLVEQLRTWQANQGVRSKPFRLPGNNREIQANFSWLQTEPKAGILIFLEDYTQLSSRAQHLKLMALGRLTASIAHEVRNPLGAISHASQLLGESPHLPSEDLRLLTIINTHTQRVNSIIQNILELSRHRQDMPEQLDIKSWLEEFIKRFSNSYKEAIHINLDVPSDQIRIHFNPSQMEQLLTNLCDNGLRHSRAAKGRAALAIEASIHPYTLCPMLDVIDEGPGVPPEKQEQIFEPFYTSEQSGTGLGLFICKEICEANQAQIFFRRTADDHSCFRIIFAHPDRHII